MIEKLFHLWEPDIQWEFNIKIVRNIWCFNCCRNLRACRFKIHLKSKCVVFGDHHAINKLIRKIRKRPYRGIGVLTESSRTCILPGIFTHQFWFFYKKGSINCLYILNLINPIAFILYHQCNNAEGSSGNVFYNISCTSTYCYKHFLIH